MGEGGIYILREYCPKLLIHWSEERALQFVKDCNVLSEIEICWLWDWFLTQIKGSDLPGYKISHIIADFLLSKLHKTHKIPTFILAKLILIKHDCNVKHLSNIAIEIANRITSFPPNLIVKPLNDALQINLGDEDHKLLVSSLSRLALKSLESNAKASYKTIDSIFSVKIEVFEKFFLVENFLNLILFTVSDQFHKGLSNFYITKIYLKCLNFKNKIDTFVIENYQNPIFNRLIHWSSHLSSKYVSYFFYKIHEHYFNTLDNNNQVLKAESDRDKLCFTAFIISLYSRHVDSASSDFYESLYRILLKFNQSGLFSFVPMDSEPLYIFKSNKLPLKLFNLLLQLADNSTIDAAITNSLWKNIKLLFEINLHEIDLTHFIGLISKSFTITEEKFYENVTETLYYILKSFCAKNYIGKASSNIYFDTLASLVSSLHKLGDLHAFFDTLKVIHPEKLSCNIIMSIDVVKIIQGCAMESVDNVKVFDSLVLLLNHFKGDLKSALIIRIFISTFLLSITIKDNLYSRKFLSSFSQFIQQISIDELNAFDSNNNLIKISIHLFLFSIFVTIRKIEACFSYTNNYIIFDKLNEVANFLFAAEKLVNLNTYFTWYQLNLCGLFLVHASLYYATRIFRNEDLWAIDSVTNLCKTLYKLSQQSSIEDLNFFYLIYLSNGHLLNIYGIRITTDLGILTQILDTNLNIQINPTLLSLTSEEEIINFLESNFSQLNILRVLSHLIISIDNPSGNILSKIIKCLNFTSDLKCKGVLLDLIEKLSHEKLLRQTFACHMINELVYPLDERVCTDCQVQYQKLDNIRVLLGNYSEMPLFIHLNDELFYHLLDKSMKFICRLYLGMDDGLDKFGMFVTFQLLKHICNFDLPPNPSSAFNCCGMHLRNKHVFFHITRSIDFQRAAGLFNNISKCKNLEKYASLLISNCMKFENNLIEMKDYMIANNSNESLDVCIGFIRLLTCDTNKNIDPQLSLDVICKIKGLNLSIENLISIGFVIRGVEVLVEYLHLFVGLGTDVDYDRFYGILKNALQNNHLKIGYELMCKINNTFPPNTSPNVMLTLFICESIFKASRNVYNPAVKSSNTFDIVVKSLENSLDFINANKSLVESGKIYIYICKIVCSLYDRMKKFSLSTIGYINVHNQVKICKLLINLSTLAENFKHHGGDQIAKHSFMCIYSLLNYGNGASQAQMLRLLNLWINHIPHVILACKSLIKVSPSVFGVKLLLDVVKLFRNKKIINSTKRYIPLLLTFVLGYYKLLHSKDFSEKLSQQSDTSTKSGSSMTSLVKNFKGEDSWIFLVIKRQIQLSAEACGEKIMQEWYFDLPISLRLYFKQIDIKFSALSKRKAHQCIPSQGNH